MNFVIGSGPAGVAAAVALVDRGLPVIMLDAGHRLEPEREKIVARLKSQSPDQWDPKELAILRENSAADMSGIPLKRAYGSAYPFQGVEEHVLEGSSSFTSLTSLAEGGLSAVWGSAVLPYSEKDLADWPIRLEELVPHYRKMLDVMNLSATSDDLESHYPLYVKDPEFLKMSRQAESFYADLKQNKSTLEKSGLHFGAARLAVRVATTQEGMGCVYCGLCLYGCPYGLIYNSAHTIERLKESKHFDYRPKILVNKIQESGDGIKLQAQNLSDGSPCLFEGTRVFLAAGVLSTARILLNSIDDPSKELVAKTSQHFILPLLRFSSVAGVIKENLHTLSQLFIEYMDPKSPHQNVHCQVYTFSDLYSRVLKSTFGRFVLAFCEPFLLGRLLIIQGYLHSADSPTLKIHLEKNSGKIKVHAQANPRAQSKSWAIARRFLGNTRLFKAIPMLPFMRISHPGGGAHIGGTFPMRRSPGPFETDTQGRPHGFKRLHLVDASVFPDIPPTTITLTIMANAHRIASQVNS